MRLAIQRLACVLALLLLTGQAARAEAPFYVIEDNDFLGPGGSDIQSTLPLLANPAVTLLGLTVVTGDGWENAEAANILRFLEIAGRTDVPVAEGAVYPLVNTVARMREWERRFGTIPWKGAWGGTGSIDAAPATEPPIGPLPAGAPRTHAIAEPAALFLIRQVHLHPHQVTIVEAGPMTNLALAIRLDPTFTATAKQLVFMGGLIDTNMAAVTGNANFASDFNILFDPEAAHIVLTADWPRIVSLGNVSGSVMMTPALMDRIAAVRTPVTEYLERYFASLPLWDEMATAVAVNPALVTRSVDAYMDVDLTDGMDYGHAHVWPEALAPKDRGMRRVTIVQAIDTSRFLDGFVRDAQSTRAGPAAGPHH
ncbi:nucleoside hydrolase [Lichenicola sp.]|uniref:nucleoside hydrolase n=1 Tax=Lichenicola sp. TaxID=2804529 RepID=UPI003B00386D